MKIIAKRKDGLYLLAEMERQTILTFEWTPSVLVVAVLNNRLSSSESMLEWACYIDSTSNPESFQEIKRICDRGSKINESIAILIFPDIHEIMKEKMFYRY